MPSNLNALIRYKTINSCLYGGGRRWSIDELTGRCSQALAEYRGRKSPVSERTIRDDIRVMRSEILGFNAPIKQKDGLYYYDDPYYSILSISLTDSGLLKKILEMLISIRQEVSHPELEILIEKLMKQSGKKPFIETLERTLDYDLQDFQRRIRFNPGRSIKRGFSSDQGTFEEIVRDAGKKLEEAARKIPGDSAALCWGDVLGLIWESRLP